MLLNMALALVVYGGTAGPSELAPSIDENEFVQFRYDPNPTFNLVGSWQGSDDKFVTSILHTEKGLVLKYIRDGERRFVVDIGAVDARFRQAQPTTLGIPSGALAARVSLLGHVSATLDYRPEEELASPEGHPCALETVKAIQQDGSVHHVSKALYITDVKKLVGYQASPGTLTIEENAVRFEVEPEVTEPYGLLMARRANGDLYFWLVPAAN